MLCLPLQVFHGAEERRIPGNTLAVQPDKPYQGLASFGTGFLSRFEGSQCPARLLEEISLVDTPGGGRTPYVPWWGAGRERVGGERCLSSGLGTEEWRLGEVGRSTVGGGRGGHAGWAGGCGIGSGRRPEGEVGGWREGRAAGDRGGHCKRGEWPRQVGRERGCRLVRINS